MNMAMISNPGINKLTIIGSDGTEHVLEGVTDVKEIGLSCVSEPMPQVFPGRFTCTFEMEMVAEVSIKEPGPTRYDLLLKDNPMNPETHSCPLCDGTIQVLEKTLVRRDVSDGRTIFVCNKEKTHRFWRDPWSFNLLHWHPEASEDSDWYKAFEFENGHLTRIHVNDLCIGEW